jgi:hypothetical protein
MTDLHLEIRAVRKPEDFAALSEISNLLTDWHTTPEELERR